MSLQNLMYFYFFMFCIKVTHSVNNLTCYQCIKQNSEPCGNESLIACPRISDRCVTHISKDPVKGFVIKRECGLGPCGFEDDMVNKGLGLDTCDTSLDEYFCVFCCKTSGCNKNQSVNRQPNYFLIMAIILIKFKFVNPL